MFEITLTSKISNRVIKAPYTARQLLEGTEIDIVLEMTQCDCQPVDGNDLIECECIGEWENCDFLIGEYSEVQKLIDELNLSKIRQMELITDVASERQLKKDYFKTGYIVNEENKKLRKALEYYADETNYKSISELDVGDKAREALMY